MKVVQQLLYKHFKEDNSVNILYLKSGTDYEKSLLKLPFSFCEAPNIELNSCTTMGFDLIISQGQEQLKKLSEIGRFLHVPILHIEYDYNNGSPGVFAHEYVFPWATQAQTWGSQNAIVPVVEVKPNTETRELDCIYVDVDQERQQFAQMLSQKYRVKQIKLEDNDFSKCGVLVNLVPTPAVQNRMLTAFGHGTTIITWNTPFFQEIIFDKQTGYLCSSPEELFNTVDSVMSNLTQVNFMHNVILQLAKSKFGAKSFTEKWKQLVNKHTNKIYRGVTV